MSAPSIMRTESEEAPGWAGRVMLGLRLATQLVGVHLLGLLGTLAGGVLAGVAPAVTAASGVAARLACGHPAASLWREFWDTWRASFVRANLVALPIWPVTALLLLDAWIAQSARGIAFAALVVLLAVVASYGVVVLAILPRVLLRYDATWGATWRYLLLAPLLFPVVSVAILVCLLAVGFLYWFLPISGVLLGLALPLALTSRLVDAALNRAEAAALPAA